MPKKTVWEFITAHINEFKTITYSVFIYLNIDVDVVQILIWLMIIDTLAGVLKALTLGRVFSFKILLFGLCTKLLVLLIPMVVALVGKGIAKTYDFTIILDCILRILVVAEGFSIITSFYVVRTKRDIKSVDIITLLLSSIRKMLLRIISATLKNINKDQDENFT